MVLPIRRVERESSEEVEQLGTKTKYWFRDGDERRLFKAEDRGTGEDWAEAIACRLAGLLGLPHVSYDLAEEFVDGEFRRHGSVCPNMAPAPAQLVLGNQLLADSDASYRPDAAGRFAGHTVDAVHRAIEKLSRPDDSFWPEGVAMDLAAVDVFGGYLLFDVWIANPDRHHANWGAIRVGDRLSLAPTFDHGSALARNLTDDNRQTRLTTYDGNRTVAAFVAKGRSALYRTANDPKPLPLIDAFREFAARARTEHWLERLKAISEKDFQAILEEAPEHRLSKVGREFTLQLLAINRRRLLGWG